jgi:hypothetical protein
MTNTLRYTQTLVALLFSLILTLLTPAFAQEAQQESQAQVGTNKFGETVNEIFMQGSIDGNNMFLVLGFKDALEIAGDSLKNAVDIENLRDIRRDAVEAGRDVVQGLWNQNHDGDMVEAARAGAQFSSSQAKKILANPLKSLAKIPNAYRTQFQSARAAYYETDNQILASVKYAGLAVWANVEGAYYLVIEAPIRMATHLLGTAIGIPGAIALQATVVAFNLTVDAIGLTLKITGRLLKAVANTAVAIGALAYSGISTGVAIAATTVAAGAVGAANGVAWLVSAPFKSWNGTHVTLKVPQAQLSLEEATAKLAEDDLATLSALGIELDDVEVKGNDFKKEIRLLKVFNKKLKVAAVIKLQRKNNNVEIKAHLKNRLIKLMHQEQDEMNRRQTRRDAKAELHALILKKLAQ